MRSPARAPRIKTKAGYHHGDLRRQLVFASRRLIDRHGVDAFRLADAAKLAGVSAAAPYRHFADRLALLAAVADDGFERLELVASDAVADHEAGSVDAVCALGLAYIDFARANPNVFRLMFGPEEQAGREVPKEGTGGYDVLIRQVAAHLELPGDSPPVLGTALSLWMYVHGFASLLIDDKLGIGRLEIDIPAMVRANTAPMLHAFVP